MTLIKRNHRFPTILEDFLANDFFEVNHGTSSTSPLANIYQDEKNYFIELAVPGYKKENFEITIGEKFLTITNKQESSEEKNLESPKFTRREFNYSNFKRTFTLDGEKIDAENTSASYDAGILKLSLPKKNVEAKLNRNIQVQ
jgi:HSP20 family protein